ncbi:hypothetical protein [Corallococcus aberystwythensis]|uniref:Uncharacterized protein n=1 Tax=Corallococcus aberystwythensis TaxID=2316722 RepID=A0A3A8P9L8_9BACT|nr:hypothetical protein [Corallococcus aberystwythensis]RKH53053.1 hypothetical protein D7W81_39500 [Corallococcus aberystwythensis]
MPACLYYDICGNDAPSGATVCRECKPPNPVTSPVLNEYLRTVPLLRPGGSAPVTEGEDEDEDEDEGEDDLPSAKDDHPAWAAVLDALAGLCWLSDTKAVCSAVAMVVMSKKVKLLVSANESTAIERLEAGQKAIGALKPSTEVKLKSYREACLAVANTEAISSVLGGNRKMKQQFLDFLTSTFSLSFVPNLYPYMHAEMRLLDQLYLGKATALDEVVYLGLSATCCDNCYKAILAFNAAAVEMKFNCQIRVFSSHGVQYSKDQWPIPLFLASSGHKGAWQGNFAKAAREKFWSQIEGGEAAFNKRPRSEQDETAHARPVWVLKSGTWVKM